MKKYFIFPFLILALCLTACSNVLDETGKKDSKKAIFYDAQTKINKQQYSEAIELLESLGDEFLAQRDVAVIYASAYSGRCGLNFINLVETLKDFTSDTSSIFAPLVDAFPTGTDLKIADCVKSEQILTAIGDATVRSPDENVLVGLSSFAKIGTILSRFSDTDVDGDIDPGFDHCDTTQLPDDAVREVGVGVALAITSISNAGDGISADALISVTNFCQLNPLLNVFCETTDKTAFGALEVAALRAIIGSTDQGIGACPGDFSQCLCP